MGGEHLPRRDFLARLGLWGTGAVLLPKPLRAAAEGAYLAELLKTAPPARFWLPEGSPSLSCSACHEKAPAGKPEKGHRKRPVKCLLCAHACVIEEGSRGRCRARANVRGELRSLVYGRPVALHVDPIEKKPFYHFLPGSQAFSLGTAGCPLACRFCQNWEISQASPEDLPADYLPPAALAERARQVGTPVIAFTYNEPTVFAEYLLDAAREARKRGLRAVLVSCGFMQEAPLREMIEVLGAIKVDLKGFSPEFYRKVSRAELEPVLRTIRAVARGGRHLEIVNLVVPTLNDDPALLDELCRWVAGEVGPDVPLHFTRFHPDFQLLHLPPTPVATLERARETALRHGLRYPYVGNVPGHPGNHTYCPSCGKAVIERQGFFVTANHLQDGACAFCGKPVRGVWQ